VITTHALLARKVQRKLRNGVAGFAAGGSSSDRKRSPIRAFSATPHDGQRAERLLKSPAEPSPELRIPSAAAQTRVVSMAGIRLGSRESARAFKGIICDDVSEFESHMPSHAVRSLWYVGMTRFSATRMAEEYIQVYGWMLKRPSLLEPLPNQPAIERPFSVEHPVSSFLFPASAHSTRRPAAP